MTASHRIAPRSRPRALPRIAAARVRAGARAGDARRFDGILRGGPVIDGTGAAARRADVAWRDGRIAAIGDLQGATADFERDVSGLVVTPGFIDVHSHADEDVVWPQYRAAPAMIHQGVTLAVFGVDGGLDPGDLRKLRAATGRDRRRHQLHDLRRAQRDTRGSHG